MTPFCPQTSNNASKETVAVRIATTSSSAAHDIQGLGPDLMLSFQTAAAYFRFGNASTTVSASGTAATQGFWMPAGGVFRLKKPIDATHLIVLRDTSDGAIYVQPGDGL